MAMNFIGEWTTVQNALLGFRNRYVLNSCRAPVTSWNWVILVLLPPTPFCHSSSLTCAMVLTMPHFAIAAAIPEYGPMGVVVGHACGVGATYAAVAAVPPGRLAGLSVCWTHCCMILVGGACVPPPPRVNVLSLP